LFFVGAPPPPQNYNKNYYPVGVVGE
jgi:hypothetical protein